MNKETTYPKTGRVKIVVNLFSRKNNKNVALIWCDVFYFWSFQPESNWWPHPYQGCALPTELWKHSRILYHMYLPCKWYVLNLYKNTRAYITLVSLYTFWFIIIIYFLKALKFLSAIHTNTTYHLIQHDRCKKTILQHPFYKSVSLLFLAVSKAKCLFL